MRKRIVMAFMMVCILSLGLLTGCGKETGDSSTAKKETDGKYKIVCTLFPQYDWVNQIAGEKQDLYDITFLLKDGVDMHNYQPSAMDIAKLGDCDLLIYVGGESDAWIDEALKNASNKEMKVVRMMDVLGDRVKEEEIVEGMQEEEHEHDSNEIADIEYVSDDSEEKQHNSQETDDYEHVTDESKEDAQEQEKGTDDSKEVIADYEYVSGESEKEHSKEEAEYDEHVWLSIKNSEIIVERIAESMAELDTVNQSIYDANAKAYLQQLDTLDSEYQNAVDASAQKTVLYGDRFPFRYLVEDYGLTYYAAFAGCSADVDASFETITFLAGKLDELSLSSILVLENSDQKVAKTIKDNTSAKNQAILVMNSLQSVTQKEAADGYTYIKAMQDNLEVLKQALQ